MSDYQEDLIASQLEDFDDDIGQDDATEL